MPPVSSKRVSSLAYIDREVTATGRNAHMGKKAGLQCQCSEQLGHLHILRVGVKDQPEQKKWVV